jgi:hypothetical protein
MGTSYHIGIARYFPNIHLGRKKHRMKCDVMDESYMAQGQPHTIMDGRYSLVEHLTSLEDHLFTVALISSLPLFR